MANCAMKNSEKMIEVFATNIQTKDQEVYILDILKTNFPDLEVNFDIDDLDANLPFCHSILRVEGATINTKKILISIQIAGFSCAILEDKICK
jgi:hypothetical protein